MDSDRLLRMKPKVIYRRYLFRIGNFRDWTNVWIDSFNQFLLRYIRKYWVVLAILFNLLAYNVAADGTGREHFVAKLVLLIDGNIDVYERAYKDIEKLATSIGTAAGVKDGDERFMFAFLITKWSREFGFDPLEVAAVALTESQFNRKAVSPKDARGLMQIHAPTWQMKDYFNTEENIKKAMRILYMYRNSQPNSYLRLYYGDTGKKGVQYVKKVRGNYKKLAEIYKASKVSNG
jgi:soluble lytic murein transglycosylase-like protein